METDDKSGGDTTIPDRIDLLELDVDTRLSDLWSHLLENEQWDLVTTAQFMRAAYGQGYLDALEEPTRGQFALDHGYRVPPPTSGT